jgi:hypothetical protein
VPSDATPTHADGTSRDIAHAIDGLRANLGERTRLTVIAGAAISLAAPSSLPDVRAFLDMFTVALSQVDPHPADLRSLNRLLWERVPFERLMQAMFDVLADSAPQFVPNLLAAIYDCRVSNGNHCALAERLVDRRIHLVLTTNFDELCERADPCIRRVVTEGEFTALADELERDALAVPTVAHLHGSVSVSGSLVALMSQVGKTIEGPRRRVLENVLTNGTLLTVGYSGRDQDIGPVLQRYPQDRIWRLVRHDPTRGLGPYERMVELNASAVHFANVSHVQRVMGRHLNALREAIESALPKLIGAVALSANMGVPAAKRLRAGQALHATDAGAVTYAMALATEHLYADAAYVLRDNPSESSSSRAVWITKRAFFRRHIGMFQEAAKDFDDLRSELVNIHCGSTDPSVITDICNVLWHGIENLLLLASAKPANKRASYLERCDELLQESEGWIAKASQITPPFDLDFYRAETALLRGDAATAIASYKRYQEMSAYWRGAPAITMASLRTVVALRAGKDTRAAIRAWYAGMKNAWTTRSLMAATQYVLTSPALLGAPTSWYWFLRRLAPRAYRIYGPVKRALFRMWAPDALPR